MIQQLLLATRTTTALSASWTTCRNSGTPLAIILGYSPTMDSRNCDGAADELRRNWIGSARECTMRNRREKKGRAHLHPAVGSARTSPSVSFRFFLESLDDSCFRQARRSPSSSAQIPRAALERQELMGRLRAQTLSTRLIPKSVRPTTACPTRAANAAPRRPGHRSRDQSQHSRLDSNPGRR